MASMVGISLSLSAICAVYVKWRKRYVVNGESGGSKVKYGIG